MVATKRAFELVSHHFKTKRNNWIWNISKSPTATRSLEFREQQQPATSQILIKAISDDQEVEFQFQQSLNGLFPSKKSLRLVDKTMLQVYGQNWASIKSLITYEKAMKKLIYVPQIVSLGPYHHMARNAYAKFNMSMRKYVIRVNKKWGKNLWVFQKVVMVYK